MTTDTPRPPILRLWAAGLVWIAMAFWLLTMALGIPLVTDGLVFALATRLALGIANVWRARGRNVPLRPLKLLNVLGPPSLVGLHLYAIHAVHSHAPSFFLPETGADVVYRVRASGESLAIFGLDWTTFLPVAFALLALEMAIGLTLLVPSRSEPQP